MPKRIDYGGRKPKKKTLAQSRERKKNKVSTQAEQIYKDIFEDQDYNKLTSDANAKPRYSKQEIELLLKTGALYEMMEYMEYSSTQLEDFLEEESAIVDVALNEARKRERYTKFTENKLRKWASMTEEQKEREAERAREELNDWRNGLTYKW